MKPLRNHTRFLIRFGAQTALGRSRRPYHGRILDLVCGAGGMFVSSARFVSEHKQQAAASQFQGENRPKDYSRDQTRELSIHGVEKTDETGRLCRLNLAVHGLEGDIRHGGQVNSYCNDPHDAAGRFNVVLAKHANGANVLHLAPEGTTGFRFPVPSSDLMNRFAEFVAPTLVQIHALHRKIQNLRRTRDLLLPRLLSGQVELKTNWVMNDDASTAFPESAEAVVATLTELFRHQGNHLACNVLENAKARIEETGYDNWDGGLYLFTLFLDLPLKVFAPIEPDVSRMEKVIAGKLPSVLRNTGNTLLREVAISPILEQPPKAVDPKIAPVDVEHLWLPSMLRLFLSHVSAHKVEVSKLKWEFRKFGISSFVAHEDIEPNLDWQREIELALRSMHTLVALLTPDFHDSKWTDQEVGFAIGKGVLVIPVRLGLDPYGFIGKLQGSPGKLDAPDKLASGVVDLLLKNKTTAGTMREALVVGLEKSPSFAASKAIAGKVEGIKFFTPEQLARMEAACNSNEQVTNSFNVPERIQRVIERFKPPVTDDTPF